MKQETNLWQRLRPKLVKHGHVQRIESGITGDGIPDVNYCFYGCEGWIELKHADQPARASTVVFKSQRGLDADQINWLRFRRKHGGRAFVLIQVGKWLLLIDGEHASVINHQTLDGLVSLAVWKRSGGLSEACVNELVLKLRLS